MVREDVFSVVDYGAPIVKHRGSGPPGHRWWLAHGIWAFCTLETPEDASPRRHLPQHHNQRFHYNSLWTTSQPVYCRQPIYHRCTASYCAADNHTTIAQQGYRGRSAGAPQTYRRRTADADADADNNNLNNNLNNNHNTQTHRRCTADALQTQTQTQT